MQSSQLQITSLIIFFVLALIIAIIAGIDIYKSKKTANFKYNVKRSISAYIFLLPASILAFIFVVLPIVYSLGYSFLQYNLLKPNDIKFDIEFQNFSLLSESLVNKGDLFYAVKNTLVFVIGVVPLQIGLALGLALFVNRKKPGVGIFKVCFFVPVVISLSVTSFLWLQILSPSETGLMNSILGIFGIGPIDFLRDKDTAMLWIVLLSAWQGCGFQMLIFSSALTNIRKDLYEAASLDGANSFQQFLYITVPQLKPTFLYVVITVFIGACRIMVQPMIMVGSEQSHILTISYYMYSLGYTNKDVGRSSALALVMTVIIGVITFLQRKFLGEKE